MEAKILNRRVTLFTSTPMVYNEQTIPDYIQKFSTLKLIPSLNKGFGLKVGPDGSVVPEQMISLDFKNLNDTFKVTLGLDRFDIISALEDEILEDFILKTDNVKSSLSSIYPNEFNRIALGLIVFIPASSDKMDEVYKNLFNFSREEFPVEWSISKVIRSKVSNDEHEMTINNVYTFSRKIIINQGQNVEGLVLECDINTLVGTRPNDIAILYKQFMKEASATIENSIKVHIEQINL
ncbi:MAG: hypothetical protein UH850_07815 [Paludibacteraceae bacterium]|nr:hypothetical protein [Paludibacteraceae bacterium]